MRPAMLPLLCCLAVFAAAGDAAPLPQLSHLAARHKDAVVRLLSHDGKALSSGFFIATVGYAVAALPGARVGDGVVVELSTGARRRAMVAKTERGSALVLVAVAAASDDELFQTLPLKSARPAANGWLTALCHDAEGRLMPAAGGLREIGEDGAWRLDLPCSRGAPVLVGDHVVGITVQSRGLTASLAVGSDRLLALSRGLSPKRPTELLPAVPVAKAPPAGSLAAP